MRFVIQVVSQADVKIDGKVKGSIGKGFLVLTGESTMQTVRESSVKPTAVFASLGEMTKFL